MSDDFNRASDEVIRALAPIIDLAAYRRDVAGSVRRHPSMRVSGMWECRVHPADEEGDVSAETFHLLFVWAADANQADAEARRRVSKVHGPLREGTIVRVTRLVEP